MAADVTIASDRFGDLTVSVDSVVAFPQGMPGFADLRRLVLLPVDDDQIFWWLHDADDPAVAFLAVVPWPFFPDYEPEVDDQAAAALELDDPADALVLNLVTVQREPERFTANLLGPVVVNPRRALGRQLVLDAELPTQAELVMPGPRGAKPPGALDH